MWAVEAVHTTLRLRANKVVVRRFRCRLRGVRERRARIVERLRGQGATCGLDVRVMGRGGGFVGQRGGHVTRLRAGVSTEFVFEKSFVESVCERVEARAVEGRKHGSVLEKVGRYSVLEGLEEICVICACGGGVVRGGGKDRARKSCSN